MNITKIYWNTPIINIDWIFSKLETYNPSWSIKDRMVWYIIEQSIKFWKLKKWDHIVEVTTWNTGISLSMFSAYYGFNFTAIMPEHMSIQRRKIMKKFWANLILTPKEQNIQWAVTFYKNYIKNKTNLFLPRQFENNLNYEAHYQTWKEIVSQLNWNIDLFVAWIWTGWTLIWVAKILKQKNPNIKIIWIEPLESAIISWDTNSIHGIQWIWEWFIPQILSENMNILDDVVAIPTKDAIVASKTLAKKYGLLVGISSWANWLVAKSYKKDYENIVTILPDRWERYL